MDRIPYFHEHTILGSILPFNVLSFFPLSKTMFVTRLQNINFVYFITVLADDDVLRIEMFK